MKSLYLYKKIAGEILISHAICFKMIPINDNVMHHLSDHHQQGPELLKYRGSWPIENIVLQFDYEDHFIKAYMVDKYLPKPDLLWQL